MTRDDLQSLKLAFVALKEYYGEPQPSDMTIRMWADDLADLDAFQVAQALERWRRNPDNARAPRPAQVRQMVRPELSDLDEATEAAARIIRAIGKFGAYQPERAKEWIGELGWTVVERQGSWRDVCRSVNDDNIGICQAQWKQLAATLHRRAKAGMLEMRPALPAPVNNGTMTQLGQVLRQALPDPTRDNAALSHSAGPERDQNPKGRG